jgi:hypothetical protein
MRRGRCVVITGLYTHTRTFTRGLALLKGRGCVCNVLRRAEAAYFAHSALVCSCHAVRACEAVINPLKLCVPLVSVVLTFKNCLCLVRAFFDRLCGLVVRVLGYRSGGPGSIPGTTRKESRGSGTGCTQPREYN